MRYINRWMCMWVVAWMSVCGVGAEPTEVREWRSTAGTAIEASAEACDGKEVSLKAGGGRVLTVPMDKLSEEDQTFLKEHFGIKEPEPGEPVDSGEDLVADGLAHPVGVVSGPVDAGGGSSYYVYVPKTLREGRKAPLLFRTIPMGGDKRWAGNFTAGADVAGMILALSVESKNAISNEECHEHTKRCLEHLMANLPIDEERVYFSGSSGGGAVAFYNAQRIKSAGIMPFNGYAPDDDHEGKHFCYGIGGGSDYNRYHTAEAVSRYKDRGVHRMHPGGHGAAPEWIGDEGVVWLNGRYLAEKRGDSGFDAERLDFEAAVIRWVGRMKEKSPFRAHYWCSFLTVEYEIEGPNAEVVADLFAELGEEPVNARYTEGLAAIDRFSKEYYPEHGRGGSMSRHITEKIKTAAQALATEYAGVPVIEQVAKTMGVPTAAIKRKK